MEKPKSELVKEFVAQRLAALAAQPENAARGALARLRRGVGSAPGHLPALWGEFLEGMPPQLLSRSGEPTRAEWAVYLALTLYALHQQGSDLHSQNQHCKGVSLGRAAARLHDGTTEDIERVWRRFQHMTTAQDIGGLAHHLRQLVQLLKAEEIGLDYALLAKDLYEYQNPDRTDAVRLRWGQDFYAPRQTTKEQ